MRDVVAAQPRTAIQIYHGRAADLPLPIPTAFFAMEKST
jgi:hypothetical protein